MPVPHLLAGPNGAGKTTFFEFVAETVFSHPSKLALVKQAQAAGYLVALHVMLVPLDLTLERVRLRGAQGGHTVPSDKVRERYERLWALVAQAIAIADTTAVYDNSVSRRPFRRVASFERGSLMVEDDWPVWSPAVLRT